MILPAVSEMRRLCVVVSQLLMLARPSCVATLHLIDARHAGHGHRREHLQCKYHGPCLEPCASACTVVYAMPAEAPIAPHHFLPGYTSVAHQRELSDAHSRSPLPSPIRLIA